MFCVFRVSVWRSSSTVSASTPTTRTSGSLWWVYIRNDNPLPPWWCQRCLYCLFVFYFSLLQLKHRTVKTSSCPTPKYWIINIFAAKHPYKNISVLNKKKKKVKNTFIVSCVFLVGCTSLQVFVASDWSIDQVEELSGRGHFPDEELQSVAFIRQMEKLGSLPASRGAAKTISQR